MSKLEMNKFNVDLRKNFFSVFLLFAILGIFYFLLVGTGKVSAAGVGSCNPCDSCSRSCGSNYCSFVDCCKPKLNPNLGCISICRFESCPVGYQDKPCLNSQQEVDKKTIDCGECNN